MQRILIAGGTGFVGKQLIDQLVQSGYNVAALSRTPERYQTNESLQYYAWNIEKNYIDSEAFENVNIIINLTGENIGEKRWTNKRKTELLESRIGALNLLHTYMERLQVPLQLLISTSAVGYYGAVTSQSILTEETTSGNDFLASICTQWESAALQFEKVNCKVVILRLGLVIGNGGVYDKMSFFAKYGISTAIGKGTYYVPWISLDDLVKLYLFILKNPAFEGVYNTVSSTHTTMNEFSNALINSFNKSKIIPNAPKIVMKMLFGEMSVMLSEGTRISNEKLTSTGFEFEDNSLSRLFKNLKS